jgi:hypothetical protein
MDSLASTAQKYKARDPGAGEVDRMFDLDSSIKRGDHGVVIGGRFRREEGRYLEDM